MSDLGTLHIKVDIDDSGVDSGLSRTEGKAKGWGSKAGGAFAGALKIGVAAAGVATAGFFAKAISGASDLAETVSKVGTVFGDQAGQVTGFADKMAKDFGLPKREILDAAASIGLIGKASGMSQGDAAGMSTQLAKLAADASSFYNVPLPEALAAIQSGLVGEAEPMRRFGVLLSAEAVDAEAAALGFTKRGKSFDEGAKAQARASLIMKGMSDASGDLERTQGSLANRIRELKGRAENFAASVGSKLLPLVLKLMDGAEALGGAISRTLAPAFKTAGDVAKLFFGSISGKGANTSLKASWLNPIINAGAKASQIFEAIREGFSGLKSAFSGEGVTADGFVGVMERIGVAARSVVDWFQANWPRIRGVVSSALSAVVAAVTGAVDIIMTVWNNFGDDVIRVAQRAFSVLLTVAKVALDALRLVIPPVVDGIKGIVNALGSPVFATIATVISTILVPALIHWGIQSTIAAAKAVAAFVLTNASAIAAAATQVLVFGLLTAQWIRMGIAALASAAQVAAAWLIAIGPIAVVIAAVVGLVALVIHNWETIKAVTIAAWNAVVNAVKAAVGWLLDEVRSIPGRILGVLGGLGSLLYDIGRSLIGGFINGIKDMFGSVRDTLGGLASKLTSWKGPPAKDAKLLFGAGRLVIGGFVAGLESSYGQVRSSLGGISRMIGGMPTGSASYALDYSGSTELVGAGSLDVQLSYLGASAGPLAVNVYLDGNLSAVVSKVRTEIDSVGRHNVSAGVKTRSTFSRG